MKKTIRLNERELRGLVKSVINEAMGVSPEDMDRGAEHMRDFGYGHGEVKHKGKQNTMGHDGGFSSDDWFDKDYDFDGMPRKDRMSGKTCEFDANGDVTCDTDALNESIRRSIRKYLK